MSKAKFRLLRYKTKKVFNFSLEIMTGNRPMDEKEIRRENIKYIFSNTLQLMKDVEKEYDFCVDIFKSHEKARLVVLQKFLMPEEESKAVEKGELILSVYNLDTFKLKL